MDEKKNAASACEIFADLTNDRMKQLDAPNRMLQELERTRKFHDQFSTVNHALEQAVAGEPLRHLADAMKRAQELAAGPIDRMAMASRALSERFFTPIDFASRHMEAVASHSEMMRKMLEPPPFLNHLTSMKFDTTPIEKNILEQQAATLRSLSAAIQSPLPNLDRMMPDLATLTHHAPLTRRSTLTSLTPPPQPRDRTAEIIASIQKQLNDALEQAAQEGGVAVMWSEHPRTKETIVVTKIEPLDRDSVKVTYLLAGRTRSFNTLAENLRISAEVMHPEDTVSDDDNDLIN